MDDPELEAIRQRRMAELQKQYGGPGGQGGPPRSQEDMAKAEQMRREAEERRAGMLMQILSPDAKARLSRLSLVKPERARQAEDILIRAAQSGQIGEKVDEAKLISLLEQISEVTKKETKVKIQRRNYGSDDEERKPSLTSSKKRTDDSDED
mmetsp:Transcript_3165/g.4851  ORF Transcript_3165/g.4851 Transcript_3165/m.4851 type:complete len:152 (+) Transcript_3165:86-541(+)|eukprot:CAMPEP_0184656468 /NCGR_PEP_ID=MMETSP0308-20130426/16529_1 /TAXON_ID=38269 /ORGANISM="Gloeochaete witrockiana, Strain SAG 46.84" /LENGTH=151 /DNA_ID=CAMNT_0027093615 /DNA_START=57 /DNA_END=515 /DNA_ORIENTATION=-